jgi:hypothetical protein
MISLPGRCWSDAARRVGIACIVSIAAVAVSSRMTAQLPVAGPPTVSPHLDSLRRKYRVPPPPVRQVSAAALLGAPGGSFGSPTAFGTASGDYFVGAGYQNRTRYTHLQDAAFSTGAGFGDPDRDVGEEVVLTSFSTVRRTPFSVGSLSLKLHHRFSSEQILVAVGAENPVNWGDVDGGRSLYATAAKIFVLRESEDAPFSIISTSVGDGNGRFRSEADIAANRQTASPFGGIGVRLTPLVSAAMDWTGQNLNSGLVVMPFREYGLVIEGGFADLTHHSGDGARFVLSVGYGFNSHVDNRILSEEDRNAVIKQP